MLTPGHPPKNADDGQAPQALRKLQKKGSLWISHQPAPAMVGISILSFYIFLCFRFIFIILIVVWVFFSRRGFSVQLWESWNSLCRQDGLKPILPASASQVAVPFTTHLLFLTSVDSYLVCLLGIKHRSSDTTGHALPSAKPSS